jgi:hypothetical protein
VDKRRAPLPYGNPATSNGVLVFWSIFCVQATHLVALQIHVSDQGGFGSKPERCLVPESIAPNLR